MSLKSIRADVVSTIGTAISNVKELPLLDKDINNAAEELYKSTDLVDSLDEMIVSYDTDTKLISLPYYVMAIRGIRYYNAQVKLEQHTIRNRYTYGGYGNTILTWRSKGVRSLAQQITNESTLRFTIPQAETSDITIKVIGKTPNSSRIQETLVLIAGTTSVESVNNFVDVPDSISKATVNTYDITVLDADDVVLGTIPNSELQASNIIFQVRDDNVVSTITIEGMEVLFKYRYKMLVNDYDEFQCRDYDKAIYWKFMEHYYAKKEDGANQAILAHGKCMEIVKQIAADSSDGKNMDMDFSPNTNYGRQRRSINVNIRR